MEIYSDDLIRISYAAAQHVLYAAWQEQKAYTVADVKRAFMTIVASAREHHVERILLNFADNIQDLTMEEYKSVLAQLTVGLSPTPTMKVACIGTTGLARKERIIGAYEQIKATATFPMEFHFFTNRATALHWLTVKPGAADADEV